VVIRPGTVDTVFIALTAKHKPILKRWWTWGGGIALATAIAVVASSGPEGEPSETSDLPFPPNRPY